MASGAIISIFKKNGLLYRKYQPSKIRWRKYSVTRTDGIQENGNGFSP